MSSTDLECNSSRLKHHALCQCRSSCFWLVHEWVASPNGFEYSVLGGTFLLHCFSDSKASQSHIPKTDTPKRFVLNAFIVPVWDRDNPKP